MLLPIHAILGGILVYEVVSGTRTRRKVKEASRKTSALADEESALLKEQAAAAKAEHEMRMKILEAQLKAAQNALENIGKKGDVVK